MHANTTLYSINIYMYTCLIDKWVTIIGCGATATPILGTTSGAPIQNVCSPAALVAQGRIPRMSLIDHPLMAVC
jgi:hypothetical protein